MATASPPSVPAWALPNELGDAGELDKPGWAADTGRGGALDGAFSASAHKVPSTGLQHPHVVRLIRVSLLGVSFPVDTQLCPGLPGSARRGHDLLKAPQGVWGDGITPQGGTSGVLIGESLASDSMMQEA